MPTTLSSETDEYYMLEAIKSAQIALDAGDVPIGAVIVFEKKIIARGWNQRELLQDPTAHAEMIALTQAAEYIGSWRLHGCRMYVTLEPCTMCAGALILSRIDSLIYACPDPKTGAVGGIYNLLEDPRHNHHIEVRNGILAEPCSLMLSDFFRQRRRQIAEEKTKTKE